MTKRLLALCLVLVFTLSFAACGKNDENNASSGAAVTSGAASADAASGDNANAQTQSKAAGSDKVNTASGNKNNSQAAGSKIATASRLTASKAAAPVKRNKSDKTTITAAVSGLKVTSGKSVSNGINLKGKTIKMAITEEGQYNTASFKRVISAFEKEYGCKIKLTTLKFNTYNQQVTQALSAGSMYDICYAHGSMFPACAIDNLYENVLPTLRTDDLMDDKNPTAGGIDLAKSSYFAYKGKLYGTCNYSSVFPYVIYYNKKTLSDAGYSGAKDPRKLAENNKWSWSIIKSMGRRLTDADSGVYFLSNSFAGRGINLAYGAPVITVSNGKYKENISSGAYVTACKDIQSWFVGNTRIAEPSDTAHPWNTYDTMLKGNSMMFLEETSKYLDMSKDVKNSPSFNRDKNNIGIVEVPLGSTNKSGKYPTGWLTAVTCGKGKDPKVAIAWDTFRSRYEDPVQDSNAMSKADKAYTDGLMLGDISCEVGQFQTSDLSALNLTSGMKGQIIKGQDISKSITQIKDQLTACIKATVKE